MSKTTTSGSTASTQRTMSAPSAASPTTSWPRPRTLSALCCSPTCWPGERLKPVEEEPPGLFLVVSAEMLTSRRCERRPVTLDVPPDQVCRRRTPNRQGGHPSADNEWVVYNRPHRPVNAYGGGRQPGGGCRPSRMGRGDVAGGMRSGPREQARLVFAR